MQPFQENPQNPEAPDKAEVIHKASNGWVKSILILIFLILLTLSAYVQVSRFEFVHWDDNDYVTENPQVNSGLTATNVAWAFKTTHMANWHPLTWISHQLDSEFFGRDAGKHHLVNLFLHLVNSFLLFLLLNRATGGKTAPSLLVALFFALHPLNVESVAWVAERKNVLSTLFWFLATLMYVDYARCSSRLKYLAVLIFFACGLMSKAMLVTFPFTLLLLDWWPLQRFRFSGEGKFRNFGRILAEKTPLFLITFIFCIITYHAQQSQGAVRSLEQFDFPVRIANAVVSYAEYLEKIFWPIRLSFFYPHPGSNLPQSQVISATLLLIVISSTVILLARKTAAPLVGWLWFLGTMVPVIGLVQVGSQGMADRYAYIPIIGIFSGVVFLFDHFLGPRKLRISFFMLAICAAGIFWRLTYLQAQTWKNDQALFTHAYQLDSNNHQALRKLGETHAKQMEWDRAIEKYEAAMKIKPRDADLHYNLALAYDSKQDLQKSVEHYATAIHYKSNFPSAHNNLGNLLTKTGKISEGIRHLEISLEQRPNDAATLTNLGKALLNGGNPEKAVAVLKSAVQSNPNLAEAHTNLAIALAMHGNAEEALTHFQKALNLSPKDPDNFINLAAYYAQTGKTAEALHVLDELLAFAPRSREAIQLKQMILQQSGQ